eukprot:GGOE01053852.1.p1 GENE.GGOE01053852.1~~GGOE01053852.1.p1  ORF type:complete len:312 (+),score=76.23 GGOE01053852.1:82-936(+)
MAHCPPPPPEVRVVDHDDEADTCRGELAAEDTLALDCEGVHLSRYGKLSLVQIGTRGGRCFLFDVLNCTAESPIVQLLACLLESPAITKIIHDCRMDSDALFHLLNIRLAGVHDTQLHAGDGLSLNAALRKYQLPLNHLHDTHVYDSNPAFWATRPLTSQMVQWASQDIAGLFGIYDRQRAEPQYNIQLERMVRQTDRHLAVCRDGVVREFSIHRDKVGTFIGKQGRSLRALEEENGVKFCSSLIKPDGWLVFAPDDATIRILLLQLRTLLAPSKGKREGHGDW